MKLRINEKETPNIEVKHEGILEVPKGKNVDDLPLSHFEKLANKKGLSKITKALNNLQVWNKNDDPKLSKWAGDMVDKLNKKLGKNESLTIKEDNVTHWDIWTETDYSLFIDGKRVKYPKYTTDRYGNYPMMVLPRYNDKTDTLSWCLYVDDGSGEMKLIEDQFINSYEAMDAGEDYYSQYLKKDESVTHRAYNLYNPESRRKEIADRLEGTFTPDDHLLICKDNKLINVQIGKKYKCTAFNGQRVEVVSVDDIYTDNRGDTATLTVSYRHKLYGVASTQLYESVDMIDKLNKKLKKDESYRTRIYPSNFNIDDVQDFLDTFTEKTLDNKYDFVINRVAKEFGWSIEETKGILSDVFSYYEPNLRIDESFNKCKINEIYKIPKPSKSYLFQMINDRIPSGNYTDEELEIPEVLAIYSKFEGTSKEQLKYSLEQVPSNSEEFIKRALDFYDKIDNYRINSTGKKSYWKYNPEDKAFYIDPDNYDYAKYYSIADIKKIKLSPCTYEEAKEIKQYSDDYAVVTTYDTDTIICCTKEEAYDQLYTGANISLYEYYENL